MVSARSTQSRRRKLSDADQSRPARVHQEAARIVGKSRATGRERRSQENRVKQSDRRHPRRRATLLRDKARVRARRLHLEFDLPIDWVRQQLERGTCAVTGIPFDLTIGLGLRFHSMYSPTIDRIDPRLGYTTHNCQVVICQYNAAKGAWTHNDVIILARSLIAHESDSSE